MSKTETKFTHPVVHGKVRLTITINDQQYIVIPKGISDFGDCPCYHLKKAGHKAVYVVMQSNSGTSCSCPDFRTRRRADLACKHIKALEVYYMLR